METRVKFSLKACGGIKEEIIEIKENDSITDALEEWVHKNIDYYFDYVDDGHCYKCANYHGDKSYLSAYCDVKREFVDANNICKKFITLEDLCKKYKSN